MERPASRNDFSDYHCLGPPRLQEFTYVKECGRFYARHRPGQRRHRHDDRLLSGAPGRAGHGAGAPRRAGRRNQLRQCRPGVAGLLHAVGGARHPAQGAEVDVPEACAAGHPRRRQFLPVALAGGDAGQLLGRPLQRQQGTHAAPGRIQPRLPAHLARRYRHPVRAAHPGHVAAVPHRRADGSRAARHRRARRVRRAVRIARPQPPAHRRAGAGARAGQAGRRPAPAQRRNRRLPALHPAAGREGQGAGRAIPLQPAGRGAGRARRAGGWRARGRRATGGRPLRRGVR
ncbi:Uncharacterised protein [Bordetella pertussis]|nr:Uncharacterised protein [Bordetella pertussis]